ncbi:MAG: sugar ABC transporter permease, partial [Pontimonas sp.]|nr:sugar ABC transporter permease [Pontimonas sp.]
MRGSVWDVIGPNLTLLVISLVAFSAIIYALFLIGSRASVRWQEWLRYGIFLGPAILLLVVGLIYPALRTIWMSFMDARSENFIGLDNYVWAFTIPEIQIVLRNTALWVVFVPILSTLIGLAIAYMTDRMKSAAVVK